MYFLNMCSKIVLGNFTMNHVNSVEISENILEISNTAKITIPRQTIKEGYLDSHFSVGDKVEIWLGYNKNLILEFTGYIREIEASAPLIIHCDDDTFILRRTNFVESYSNASLSQILKDVLKDTGIVFECPEVQIGKYQIDNQNAFMVLQDLMKNFGLYSRLENGVLKIGLAFSYGQNVKPHKYIIGHNVKKSELKYQRKEDFKIRFNAIAHNPNGTKTKVTVGSTEQDASERTLNFIGPVTEQELRNRAINVMKKVVYDGYTGSITGFGIPCTRAGHSLNIKDKEELERDGTYLIEKLTIIYDESNGFERKNELTFRL